MHWPQGTIHNYSVKSVSVAAAAARGGRVEAHAVCDFVFCWFIRFSSDVFADHSIENCLSLIDTQLTIVLTTIFGLLRINTLILAT